MALDMPLGRRRGACGRETTDRRVRQRVPGTTGADSAWDDGGDVLAEGLHDDGHGVEHAQLRVHLPPPPHPQRRPQSLQPAFGDEKAPLRVRLPRWAGLRLPHDCPACRARRPMEIESGGLLTVPPAAPGGSANGSHWQRLVQAYVYAQEAAYTSIRSSCIYRYKQLFVQVCAYAYASIPSSSCPATAPRHSNHAACLITAGAFPPATAHTPPP
jgi:hypothetical protein